MTKNNKKGFTIIEVVLVLAIAGLIFLMVFIALPALQRSQRNTRRRQDMARILSAVNDYQTNHNGKSPAMPGDSSYGNNNTHASEESIDENFVIRYIDDTCTKSSRVGNTVFYSCTGDQFKDPDGSEYSMYFTSGYVQGNFGENSNDKPSVMQKNHTIILAVGVKCSGNESAPFASIPGLPASQVALGYVLEGGAIYCGDNQ